MLWLHEDLDAPRPSPRTNRTRLGANDMANAIGPLASVWTVYSTGTVGSKAEVPIWLLIHGGVALDIGIVTMGHHIMAALDNRPALQSPSACPISTG
jgi:phosphate/sulfate permease